MKNFIFIHYIPTFLIQSKTKKECIGKIKSLCKNKIIYNSEGINVSEYINKVSDTSILRCVFETKITEYSDLDKIYVEFKTYRLKSGVKMLHLEYGNYLNNHLDILPDKYNAISAPYSLIKQYNYIRRISKIKSILSD